MPLYDFKCNRCGSEEELFLSVEDRSNATCLKCGHIMARVFNSPAAVQYDENDSIDFELTGEPIVYHTKGQIKRIAAQHGCVLRD
jgi:putative FmdB family regulatory protein